MWNIISRLYNFTYEMIFRLTRRIYHLVTWTHPKPILPPKSPSQSPCPSPLNSQYVTIDMDSQLATSSSNFPEGQPIPNQSSTSSNSLESQTNSNSKNAPNLSPNPEKAILIDMDIENALIDLTENTIAKAADSNIKEILASTSSSNSLLSSSNSTIFPKPASLMSQTPEKAAPMEIDNKLFGKLGETPFPIPISPFQQYQAKFVENTQNVPQPSRIILSQNPEQAANIDTKLIENVQTIPNPQLNQSSKLIDNENKETSAAMSSSISLQTPLIDTIRTDNAQNIPKSQLLQSPKLIDTETSVSTSLSNLQEATLMDTKFAENAQNIPIPHLLQSPKLIDNETCVSTSSPNSQIDTKLAETSVFLPNPQPHQSSKLIDNQTSETSLSTSSSNSQALTTGQSKDEIGAKTAVKKAPKRPRTRNREKKKDKQDELDLSQKPENPAKKSENPPLQKCQKWSEECTEDYVESESVDNKPKNRRAKRRKKNKGDEIPSESGPSRPNYFLAFQVSDKDIKSKVSEIQGTMLQKELTSPTLTSVSRTGNIFKDTMVPVEKLHFTLHVFHLKGHAEVQTAIGVLEKCFLKVKDEFEKSPMVVNIQGVGHFRNAVLFAKIEGDAEISRLESLCADLRAEYEKVNITGDSKDFKPHMTIAKMSRSKKLQKQKVRAFPPEIWSEFEAAQFGHQRVESLQLLSMTESDPVTGYYRTVAQFDFPAISVQDITNVSITNSEPEKT